MNFEIVADFSLVNIGQILFIVSLENESYKCTV